MTYKQAVIFSNFKKRKPKELILPNVSWIIEKITKLFLQGMTQNTEWPMTTYISFKCNKYSNAQKMAKWPSNLIFSKFQQFESERMTLKPNDYPCSFSSPVFSKWLKTLNDCKTPNDLKFFQFRGVCWYWAKNDQTLTFQ